MHFKRLLTSKSYWLPALALLGAVVVAIGLYVSLSGGSNGIDVERLVRERKALVAEANAGVTIIETTPSTLSRTDVVPSVIAVAAGQTTAVTALAYDQSGRQLHNVSFRYRLIDPGAGTISRTGIFIAGFSVGTFQDAVVVEATDRATGTVVEGKATVAIFQAGQNRTPAALKVFPSEILVGPNETIQFTAYALDANGIMVPEVSIAWELLEPRAGSITTRGRFVSDDHSGNYPGALKASVRNKTTPSQQEIAVILDVQIIDTLQRITQPYVSVSPQVVTVLPGQTVQFVVAVLDPKGQAISPLEVSWRLASSRAGDLSDEGKFVAAATPGIYENLIRAHINAPNYQGGYSTRASATVIITEVPKLDPGATPAIQPVIFPARIELSPGQSETLVIVGTNNQGARLDSLRVRWRLDRPELGEINPNGRLTAGSTPGVYPDAIVAEIESSSLDGSNVREAKATLVVRGPLDRVELRPAVAEVSRNGRIQFLAVAYDASGVSIPNIQFQWEVTDSRAGTIDQRGLFTASGQPGSYNSAVRVKAIQLLSTD